MSNMNYAAPPCDVVEYPVSNNILLHTAEHWAFTALSSDHGNYHSKQYTTHVSLILSTNTHFEYSPLDPTPFQHTTYNSMGYFSVYSHHCLPLEGQYQQS